MLFMQISTYFVAIFTHFSAGAPLNRPDRQVLHTRRKVRKQVKQTYNSTNKSFYLNNKQKVNIIYEMFEHIIEINQFLKFHVQLVNTELNPRYQQK